MKRKRIKACGKGKPGTSSPAANDIDIVVNMVNEENQKRKANLRAKAQQARVDQLERREREVFRREQRVYRKEMAYQAYTNMARIVLDAAVIGFSIIGMATVWIFCRVM